MTTLNNSIGVELIEANETDIAALANISALSYVHETFNAFFFTDWPNQDAYKAYFLARVTQTVQDPLTKVIKIIDLSSKEITGFVCLTLSGRDAPHNEPNNPGGNFVPPPGFNLEFAAAVMTATAKLEDLFKGQSHYLLTSLSVTPKHQRKGIGSLLVKHCIEISDAEVLPIFLNSFPTAHGLYLRLGFEDLKHCDIDLNQWGTKYRGYGIYRTYAMVRRPAT